MHLEEQGVHGRTLLIKWIIKKWDEVGTHWIYLAQDGQVAGACECSNKHSGSIKCGEFLD
jgi:hypothetical protein